MYTFLYLSQLLKLPPQGMANIQGSPKYPKINGEVRFYQSKYGTVVVAQLLGLPSSQDPCAGPILGFHIHSGTDCSGNQEDPFANAGTHYNPNNCPHPYHAGDMPPLFVTHNGYAFLAFISSRFTPAEVIGKTVVIHSKPDDFTSQPAGNAGEKIACGVIIKTTGNLVV